MNKKTDYETRQLCLFSENEHILQQKKPKIKKRKHFIFNFKAKNKFTNNYFNGEIEANSETEFKKIFKKNYTTDILINFANKINK